MLGNEMHGAKSANRKMKDAKFVKLSFRWDSVQKPRRFHLRIMKESISTLGAIKDFIIKGVSGKGEGGRTSENIAGKVPPEAEELVVKLEKSLDLIPPEYFEVLLKNLDAEIQKAAGPHG